MYELVLTSSILKQGNPPGSSSEGFNQTQRRCSKPVIVPLLLFASSVTWDRSQSRVRETVRQSLQRTEREDESDCGAQAILATANPGQEAREGGVHVIHFKRPESETLGDPQIDAAAGHEGKVSL